MSVATKVVGLMFKDVVFSIVDGTYWHPVCMKACVLCIGAKFKIHLEHFHVRSNEYAYEYHKYDNCFIILDDGTSLPLTDICRVLNLPLPKIMENGRFDTRELYQAIKKEGLQLNRIEVILSCPFNDTIRYVLQNSPAE